MPKKVAEELTREAVARFLGELPASKTRRLWDSGERGLVLVASTGCATASWFVSYRNREGRKRLVRVADQTAKLADVRKAARTIKGEVTTGLDPLESKRAARVAGMTVAEAWEAYRAHKRPTWKPKSLAVFEHHAATKIVPALGAAAVARLTTAEVEAWHRKVSSTAGGVSANRALALLTAIINHWIAREAPDRPNPCRGVARNREARRERHLSLDEIGRLWLALDELQSRGPERAMARVGESTGRGGKGQREATARGISRHQAALIKLLLLTAARLGEVQTVTWDQVRLGEAVLALVDSKVGARRIVLPAAAVEILAELGPQRTGPVIVGRDGQRGLNDIRRAWARACKTASIEGATPHCLRHTTATVMASVGAPVLSISTILGHSISTSNATAIYLHAASEAEARGWLERAVDKMMGAVDRAREQAAEAAALAGAGEVARG